MDRRTILRTLAGAAGLLTVIAVPGIMVAQNAATSWSVRRPYIEFFDQSPHSIPSPKQVTGASEANGFDLMTRYQSPTALAEAFHQTGITNVPPPADLSTWLSQQEAAVETKYIPLLEQWGHLEPGYDEISGPADDQRFIMFAYPPLGTEFDGEYNPPSCYRPRNGTRATIGISPTTMSRLNDPYSAFRLREVLTHELLHGSQETAGLCLRAKWITEGGADGYAMQASWLADMNDEKVRLNVARTIELYQPRRYYLPLDLDYKDLGKFAAGGGLNGGAAVSEASLFDQKEIQDYFTGSYFRYLLDAQPSGAMAYELFYSTSMDRPKLYELIKKHFGIDAPQHFAAFFTEFASYGGGRYKHFTDKNAESGVSSITTAETTIRRDWLGETFGCREDPEIQLDGSAASARSIVDIPNFAPLSGRCLRVTWKDIKPAVNLSVQVLVNTRVQADAIWLGQSYVNGASHNQPEYDYCYQNVTNGGGTYGEPISNDRGSAAAVDACLFRKSEIRENVTLNGKNYFAVTFTTKYKLGTEAGEADFIVTNAAPKAKDNEVFDAQVLVQKVTGKIAWTKTGDHALDRVTASDSGDDKDIWTMVGNKTDVYFNPSTKASRDLKMQGADASQMLAALADMEEDGTSTIIGGDGFMLQIGDSKEGTTAMLLSMDGRYMAVGGRDDDGFEFATDCGLKNDLKVIRHDNEGMEFTYQADVMDMSAMMSAALSGREPTCDDIRNAIYDRISIDMILPDGQLHTYDGSIRRSFPAGYDEAVDASLTANGLADLGGLPRRVDQPTFLDGMNGAPPSDMTFPPVPSDDSSDDPPLDSGWPGVPSGVSCSTPDIDAATQQLKSIAQQCTCTCAALDKADDLMESIMERVGPTLGQNAACAQPLLMELSSTVQRVQVCRLNTCRSMAGKC